MEKVRADKLREVKDGHDGTWIAHPALLPIAKEVRRRQPCSDETKRLSEADCCVRETDTRLTPSQSFGPLLSTLLQVFDEHMRGPNQLHVLREDVHADAEKMLEVPTVS